MSGFCEADVSHTFLNFILRNNYFIGLGRRGGVLSLVFGRCVIVFCPPSYGLSLVLILFRYVRFLRSRCVTYFLEYHNTKELFHCPSSRPFVYDKSPLEGGIRSRPTGLARIEGVASGASSICDINSGVHLNS